MTKEIWKSVDGYSDVYKVSNLGRVKSVDRINAKGARVKGKVLKTRKNNSGYLTVHLYNGSRESRKIHYVHRLVAQTFLDDMDETVNHKDGIKTNNNIDNLEWVSQSVNISKAYKSGLMHRCGRVKVTTPSGEEISMNTYLTCSEYFGFKGSWVQNRVKVYGKSFVYNGHSIKVE